MEIDYINQLDVADGFIKSIFLYDNIAEIVIEKWNTEIIQLIIKECWCLKDMQSTNREISHLRVFRQSALIDEVIADIAEGGGTKDIVKDAVQITFYDVNDESIVLEVVATSIEIFKPGL